MGSHLSIEDQVRLTAPRHWFGVIMLGIIAIPLILGGARLVSLAGSPYYAIAGVWLGATAVMLWRRLLVAYAMYGVFLVGTLGWGVAEVGLDPWGLNARLLAPLIVAGMLAVGPAWRRFGGFRTSAALGLLAVMLVVAYAWLVQDPTAERLDGPLPAAGPASEWSAVDGDGQGGKFTSLAQITPANVASLRVAWTYRTGDLPAPTDAGTLWTQEATPIQIGTTLYLCTSHSQVHAIDAETGRRKWVFNPHSRPGWVPLRACRGVAYYKTPGATGSCAERIVSPIGDARLVALDAQTGRICPGFGDEGYINQIDGLGSVRPGYYYTSSAPVVIDGKVVVNSFVLDGAESNEPSGVIRAYDAVTGQLAWAWDMGVPERTGAPPPGQSYTRGTPNSWPPMTVDEQLNQVYVPLGNATPDFFGGLRRPDLERYRDAVVALDAATGRPRWSFQTTHHDLWDHDLPAQPTLVDLQIGGGKVLALVQPTKRGELFVLDRRTGKPLKQVAERPAPKGALPGDFTSPTQPYSNGMPSFAGPDLTEARMWGMTPLDQLWCRIRFRELRYEGQFTPPTVGGSLIYPGNAGVFSWGGIAIDRVRGLLIANTTHTPFVSTAIPRRQADAMGLDHPTNSPRASNAMRGGESTTKGGDTFGYPQIGAPYAAQTVPFLSPLSVPCMAPPWGRISGIDLASGKLKWSRALGTSRDGGPMNWHHGPPLTIGVPNAGGPVVIGSGLFFIAATQDRYLRAIATSTGRELWRARLPAGGQATPMSYVGPSGRQFVVISAGGHGGLNVVPGDYVVAFALR